MKRLLIVLIFLLLMPSNSAAWWNASLPYRYNIANTSTLDPDISFSINDTGLVNGTPLRARWDSGCQGIMNVYSELSGPAGDLAVANDSAECNWENSSSHTGNNNPTMVCSVNQTAGWYFDEHTLDANDSCRYNYDGSPVGDGTTLVSGIIGNAVDYAGSSDYTTYGDLDIPPEGAPPYGFAISFWVNFDAFAGETVTMGTIDIDFITPGWAIGSDATNFYYAAENNPSQGAGWDVITVYAHGSPTNVWIHMVYNYDGTNMDLYLNGSLFDSEAEANDPGADNNAAFHIGGHIAEWMDGTVDEVMFFNRSLTISEIRQIYWIGINNLTSLGNEEVPNIVPTVNLVAPVIGVTLSDLTPEHCFYINDTNTGDVLGAKLYINGTQKGSDSTVTNGTLTCINSTILSNGWYEWYIEANDSIDVVNSSTWNFTILLTGNATIHFTYPENQTYTAICDIPLWTYISDNSTEIDTYSYSLDNSNWTIFTPNTTLFNLDNGNHNISVKVNLTNGWENSSELIFSVNYNGFFWESNTTDDPETILSYITEVKTNMGSIALAILAGMFAFIAMKTEEEREKPIKFLFFSLSLLMALGTTVIVASTIPKAIQLATVATYAMIIGISFAVMYFIWDILKQFTKVQSPWGK